ncbi:hypothetical protein Y032_0045g1273 [Ancylostoma ceylanicum]|uniref:Uncharacterized protein n=1 Tax=Ancylostoma ceylanicum TaxID=53326 RepID=A0A016UCT7_9BILA|nr:hypothetical protein Y032_0045g1273 [Ancylostoma ceylanicum]
MTQFGEQQTLPPFLEVFTSMSATENTKPVVDGKPLNAVRSWNAAQGEFQGQQLEHLCAPISWSSSFVVEQLKRPPKRRSRTKWPRDMSEIHACAPDSFREMFANVLRERGVFEDVS